MDREFFQKGAKELGLASVFHAVEGKAFKSVLANGVLEIEYTRPVQVFRALKLAEAGIYSDGSENGFDSLGAMCDCSRNAVLRVEAVERLLRHMAVMGYDNLMLYTEDTFEVEGEPYFGYLRGRYTQAELQRLDAYAQGLGIELIPCVQTLAHLNQIFHWREYEDVRDVADILLAGEERTYKLIDNIFAQLARSFTSRKVNIGMDEAPLIGLGAYREKHGVQDRLKIMAEHLNKVMEIASKYGFQPMMWSDMFFRLAFGGEYYRPHASLPKEILDQIPKGVELVYWDYDHFSEEHYERMMNNHRLLPNRVAFACGAWKWCGFAPDNTLSVAAQNAGIAACKKCGIRDVTVTMWGDDGAEASVFTALPSLVNAAANVYGGDAKAQFAALTGAEWEDFALMDRLNRLDPAMRAEEIGNFSKCYLYNDVFLGFLDSNVAEGVGRAYAALSERLQAHENGAYGYMFRTLARLAEALAVKSELGVRARAYYKRGDKKGLDAVSKDIVRAEVCVERFYEAYREQWYAENKPNGFEVQDIRLGGLMLRLSDCARRIDDYLAGKLPRLEELEEELLDFKGPENGFRKHNGFYFNCWYKNVSPNAVKWLNQ